MEIPGYYFDPVKHKYFKIQRNHIAPPDSTYSVEAIKERNLRNQAEQIEEAQRFKERLQLLKHDRRVHHPLTGLQHRLGNYGPGSTTSYVADYYSASLQRCPVLEPGKNSSTHFTLNHGQTDTLVIGTTDIGRRRTSSSPVMSIVSLRRESNKEGTCAWTTGNRGDIAQTPGKIASLMLTSYGLLAWTEDPGTTGNAQLHVAGLSHTTYEAVTHAQYTTRNEQKMQLTASPTGSFWLGWTSSTIFLRHGNPQSLDRYQTILTSLNHLKKDSLLTVAFKDEWTLMAGHRSGFVNFLDHREGLGSQVRRMRHDDPLNTLRILKDGHTVLANGLASTALYDLRYLKAPRTSKKSEPCSTPLLRFSIPRTSDRLELGLDYHSELNLVAIASSRNKSHYVTLYSTRNGRQVPSAMDRTALNGPIPCLKFAYSPERPNSLLMAPESEQPTLVEWACDV